MAPWMGLIIRGIGLSLALILACPQLALSGTKPRQPGVKLPPTALRALPETGAVIVKFQEGLEVRLRDGKLHGLTPDDREALKRAMAPLNVTAENIRPQHGQPVEALDALRATAEANSAWELADLNNYYRIKTPRGQRSADIADALNGLPFVEFARPASAPVRPPQTSDYSDLQGYLDVAPDGVGALYSPFLYRGADGKGVSCADIEYSWRLDHEDLQLPPDALVRRGLNYFLNAGSPTIQLGTLNDPFSDDSHGTKVVGIVSAKKNGFGMTGIAPGAGVKLIPVDHVETGYDPAEAVTRAWGATEPGDAILIELQAVACDPAASGDGSQLGPAEWEQDVFDAISIVTAAERIVVEAAGNGAVNLDHPSCNGLFDPNVRDSGAIIVGAGASGNHARAGASSFGARVNVQGWGGSVATTTTDLNFSLDLTQNDPTRRYTSGFSGTSSASAIVTGAVVAIQGRYKACRGGGETLSAFEMRELLVQTGTPQWPGDQSGTVGPLPDIRAALEARDAYSPKSCAARNPIHPALIEDGN